DDFKIVNDRYGHEHGDAFLREFATILKSMQNGYNLFYRIGGDEFIGMIFADEAKIRHIASTLLEKTRKITLAGCALCPSVSIGVIRATAAGDLIRKADEIMYQVKNSGKNHYRYEIEQSLDPATTGSD
ncbi:MAG: GGDEF domain-containing protein, partial [bacterium]